MIITDEELFDFFKSKVDCAIAQIKSRGWHIWTSSSYTILRDRNLGIWVPSNPGFIHPLGFFLENQKTLYDKSVARAISRRLNCKLEFIESFNEGLKGKQELLLPLRSPSKFPKKSVHTKFFMYGRKVRTIHAKKKLKKKK